MTPPVFFAVAALGLAAPLIAQTPVHSMPGEAGASFTCLPILAGLEDADSRFCGIEAEEATRADRNVLIFSDLSPLAPDEHFCAGRIDAIEGLEVASPALQETLVPVPKNLPSRFPGGVETVGRITPTSSAATAVPEPSSAWLAAVATMGLIRRRRS